MYRQPVRAQRWPAVGMLAALALVAAGAAAGCVTQARDIVNESERRIPIAYQVDVVVVGGSSGAVAAACAAAEAGADVFLAAPRPYLGEDLCATGRLWLEQGEVPDTPLAACLFAEGNPARPMHVKRTLDDALLNAGVDFLFACYATDVLRDADGRLAGIVMANRAGRQAVVAKVIIDATDRACVARMAGADFAPFPAGNQTLKRVVIGGRPNEGPSLSVRRLPVEVEYAGAKGDGPQRLPIFEYTLRIPMPDASFPSWARAEQAARDLTYHPDQLDDSEVLFHVPPDPMTGQASVARTWDGVASLDLGAFRPKGVERMWVLGGCADLPRDSAARMLRPPTLIAMGARVGRAAADEAAAVAPPKGPGLSGNPAAPDAPPGDVGELLVGARPTQDLPTLSDADPRLPVLGEWDVVVVGGGTGGAPAGIAAARRGARTLVVEYLHGLGGVETMGLINKYYYGYRGGFTAEIDRGVGADEKGRASVVRKKEWFRAQLRDAGADLWFGAMGCGALVHDGRVRGVVVATPEGRGVVLANVVIDATGNADVAIAAGALYDYTGPDHVAVQGAGLPPRRLGADYTNTDYMFVDETDLLDTWHLLVYAKRKFPDAYDLGQLLDTRERRRIVGDFVLSPLDILNGRTYPDAVAQCHSNFDTHGFTVHPVFALKPPDRAVLKTFLPYRCLLPKGLEGILVTGLAVSAHRDAMPIVRMQPDIQNEGYAAGCAAAMAAKAGKPLRKIDVRALQKHLVETECLPESVLTDTDSYPLPTERVAEAVRALAAGYDGLPVVLAHLDRALPLLRKAHADAASDNARRLYAHVLGMMGDAAGAGDLLEAV